MKLIKENLSRLMKLEKPLQMRKNYLVAEVSPEAEIQESLWNNTYQILLMITSTG
jgi:hypothetical protein